jgi:hypothetical protein
VKTNAMTGFSWTSLCYPNSARIRILQPIGEHHPKLINDFLNERWDDLAQSLVQDLSRDMQTGDLPEAGAISESDRQGLVAQVSIDQLEAARRAIVVLGNLVAPPTRQSIHDLLAAALHQFVEANESLTEVAANESLTAGQALAASARHSDAMAVIRRLGEDIERIRVMEHSAE